MTDEQLKEYEDKIKKLEDELAIKELELVRNKDEYSIGIAKIVRVALTVQQKREKEHMTQIHVNRAVGLLTGLPFLVLMSKTSLNVWVATAIATAGMLFFNYVLDHTFTTITGHFIRKKIKNVTRTNQTDAGTDQGTASTIEVVEEADEGGDKDSF